MSIPKGWIEGEFEAFVTLQRGFDLPVQDRREGSIPIIASNGQIGFHNVAKVKAPGVVTGRSGTIGKVSFERTDFWPLNTSLYVSDFHENDELYCYYFLQGFKLDRFSNGTGVPTLNRNDVHPTPIIFPPLHEQKKIAEILLNWDRYIAILSQLINSKTRAFEKRQNQLMIGDFGSNKKLRNSDSTYGQIPKHWHFLELGFFLSENKRVTLKPKNSYLGLGIRSHGKGTFLKKDVDPTKSDLEELHEVRAGDLIVNITFAWEGAVAIAKQCDDGALTSHRFPSYTVDEKKVLRAYLQFLIIHHRMIYDLGLKSPGGAGRNRVLSRKDFLNIKVPVPPIDEQFKISNYLVGLKYDLSMLEEIRSRIQKQKQGLMQKLLTGKVRVKV